jgi:hypothetical protein
MVESLSYNYFEIDNNIVNTFLRLYWVLYIHTKITLVAKTVSYKQRKITLNESHDSKNVKEK